MKIVREPSSKNMKIVAHLPELSVWELLMKNSAVARRMSGLLMKFPRSLQRSFAQVQDYSQAPPIVVNSIPKSGTNLLAQIANAIPNTRNYGTLWTSIPSYSYREYPKKKMLSMIDTTVPGEVVVSHLFSNPDYHELLQQKKAVHFFLYRDPRDVAISESCYLTYMNKWHRLHSYYKTLSSDEERISFSILGDYNHTLPFSYPNIADRFHPYLEWITQENVWVIRFEDLVPELRRETIKKMMIFYVRQTGLNLEIDELVIRAMKNINPIKSHTFRDGKVGSWKKVLTRQQKEQVKSVAGNLLIKLGYEKDMTW